MRSLFFGLGLILIGLVLFVNPMGFIHLLDNKEQTITLFENVNNATTELNLNFNFDKDYISRIYEVSEGEKVFKNYINFYSTEFLDNETAEQLEYAKINDNVYVPVNKTYQYSLVIEEDTLNQLSQTLYIKKSNGLEIDKITIDYIGADYSLSGSYGNISFIFSMLVISFGIIISLWKLR